MLQHIGQRDLIRVSALSGVDMRTLKRVKRGLPVRASTLQRVQAALIELGLGGESPEHSGAGNADAVGRLRMAGTK